MPLCPFCREAEAPYLMAAVRRCRGSAGIPGLDGDLRDLTRVRCGCLSELSRPINGERSRRAANILRRGCALAVVPWTEMSEMKLQQVVFLILENETYLETAFPVFL